MGILLTKRDVWITNGILGLLFTPIKKIKEILTRKVVNAMIQMTRKVVKMTKI